MSNYIIYEYNITYIAKNNIQNSPKPDNNLYTNQPVSNGFLLC